MPEISKLHASGSACTASFWANLAKVSDGFVA
jgi:hypothetical protein